MSLYGRKAGGYMDVIRCDEPSYLIWKWHPSGTQLSKNTRENAIRFGSTLRVKAGEVAVFVYSQKDGTVLDYIEGPFDKIVETNNLPVLSDIVGLAYDGGTPFQAEIYFINLAKVIQVKFGVPFFDVFDPRFMDFGVPVAVRGTISFHINEYREFIKLHQLNTFDLDDFQKQIRDVVNRYIKGVVTNIPLNNNIPVVQLESRISQINDAVEFELRLRMKERFGIEITGVDIGSIEIDKSSEGYRQLMSVTKNITSARLNAETIDYTEKLRIQREEGQYAMHMQTQSANMGAFNTEKQAEVGIAGAEALAQMETAGVGSVNLSDGSIGFNPASMMVGMTLGNAVGQSIASTMNNMMSGLGNVQESMPPSLSPTIKYHVALNGKASGPYDLSVLQQLISSGVLTKDTLVWKNGMENWDKAENQSDIRALFESGLQPVPPIPSV